MWLGRKWGGIAHLIGVGREVVETRAVQRRPKEERWDVAAIEGLLATPWCNPAPEDGDQEVVVLPPRPEGPAAPAEPAGPNLGMGANRVYARDVDLKRYGYTAACRRCARMREGRPARGVRHTPACRARIEAAMQEAGDVRLAEAQLRQSEELARRTEAAEAAAEAVARPVGGVCILPRVGPAAADGVAHGLEPHEFPEVPAPAAREGSSALPAGAGSDAELAERMQVEADDDAALLEALRQEGVVGPQTREAAREASKVYELLLVTGVRRGDAVAKVSELFSPPRVTAELGRLPCMSLVGGS